MTIDKTQCMLYAGSISEFGYGIIRQGGKRYQAHRVMYETYVGEIKDGKFCDHLCRERSCINPDHIEPVTNATNVMRGEAPSAQNARKTHCKNGHAYTDENMRVRKNGWRVCIPCHTDYMRMWRKTSNV